MKKEKTTNPKRSMTREELKRNIGKELYDKLTKEDKEFMIKTATSIGFGYPVDLKKIKRYLTKEV